MNKKVFLMVVSLVFIFTIFVSTCAIAIAKPKLHQSFMLEIINYKFKK